MGRVDLKTFSRTRRHGRVLRFLFTRTRERRSWWTTSGYGRTHARRARNRSRCKDTAGRVFKRSGMHRRRATHATPGASRAQSTRTCARTGGQGLLGAIYQCAGLRRFIYSGRSILKRRTRPRPRVTGRRAKAKSDLGDTDELCRALACRCLRLAPAGLGKERRANPHRR